MRIAAGPPHMWRVRVHAVSTGGNISPIGTSATFNAAAPTGARRVGDMTGDGQTDLITIGGINGLGSGIWQAQGTNATPNLFTTNIGVNGDGMAGIKSPANFDGGQVVPGAFRGNTLQDVVVYYPTASAGQHLAGTALSIFGNGDGSALNPTSGNTLTINANDLLDLDPNHQPIPGSYPIQVVNGAAVCDTTDSVHDLITLGGTAGNYHLTCLPNIDFVNKTTANSSSTGPTASRHGPQEMPHQQTASPF